MWAGPAFCWNESPRPRPTFIPLQGWPSQIEVNSSHSWFPNSTEVGRCHSSQREPLLFRRAHCKPYTRGQRAVSFLSGRKILLTCKVDFYPVPIEKLAVLQVCMFPFVSLWQSVFGIVGSTLQPSVLCIIWISASPVDTWCYARLLFKLLAMVLIPNSSSFLEDKHSQKDFVN